jgi:uncharacterized protein
VLIGLIEYAMNPESHASLSTPASSDPQSALEHLNAAEFAELNAILDSMRLRREATPTWEFCEGFMAALICCRRTIAPAEYWPALLSVPDPWFNAIQQKRFGDLWIRRWNAVMQALDTKVAALDDAAAYQPEVVDARAAKSAEAAPFFGQLWAQGFMAAVKAWPEEWAGSRNKQAIQWRTAALAVMEALTGDDTDPPTLAAFADDPDAPPTVSARRMQAFGDAIWAVYNMREMWRSLGPRIETVHKLATPGRNDPCACGSGKKYKKCCDLLSLT